MRSWLHVQDFCNAIDLISQNAPDFETYNVSGEERTNLQVLGKVAEHLDRDIDQHIEYVHDRPSPDLRYAVASTKLQNTLGWQPQFAVDRHLGDVIGWYADNPGWWQAIKNRKEFLDHYEKQSKGQWY